MVKIGNPKPTHTLIPRQFQFCRGPPPLAPGVWGSLPSKIYAANHKEKTQMRNIPTEKTISRDLPNSGYRMLPRLGVDEDFFELIEVLLEKNPGCFREMFQQTPKGLRNVEEFTYSLWSNASRVESQFGELCGGSSHVVIKNAIARDSHSLVPRLLEAKSKFQSALQKLEAALPKGLPKGTRTRLTRRLERDEEQWRSDMAALYVAVGFVMGVRSIESYDAKAAFRIYHIEPEV
jgi:hypothetical protein